ncbi:Gem-associated protein 5 [Eufriesea mexicana]|uniref:Gem-associated protein 5 n=1 Tax=Eufriesea mexicana TaxID=516756 RepID=A0A310SU74_9HYME|nr:PREDICTED: gem-associated protein 5 [Eufriesea mexicana]OAD62256.1 Gem-associated protein 5 [Eufriesea mexicana]
MNEATLPPSPNWYLSNILACSFNGTVAWGARNAIVIAKSSENNEILQYSIINHAHKSKVTSLAFTPQFEVVNANLIASTGDDNIIKVWDLDTLSTTYTHSLETDKQAIGVDWSYTDPHIICAAISDGCVLSWNIHFDVISSILLGKVIPTCISSCPHDSYLVAVGSKSGLIYIINFQGKGKIIYKLRGHDTEIVSLSWCPAKNNVLSESLSKDLLLASGGKDRSVFIWKAGGDGRYEMKISLPGKPLDSHQHRSKLNASVGNWVVVKWIEPKLLLTSSFWGELISWDLSMMTNGKPNVKLIHGYHGRGLFCIAHVPNIQDISKENWRIKPRHTIWTLAQDRRIICCGIKENNVEIDYDIFTQSGYIYCIAACPLDTSHVAFGVGDAMLRLWNLSEAHDTTFDIMVLWQKIKGKIRAISWHPEKENLLAYATEEGRVGVFNTNSNKLPILYRQYHRNTIYTLSWGPNPENEQYVLYSCGEKELVYYDVEKPNQEPKSIEKECTEFSWKPDFSYLAVGFENGTITFFNRKFEACGYAKFSSKIVHCLAWHPESTTTDITFSSLRNYLAVAFESCTILIFDLSNFIDYFAKLEDSSNNDNLKEKCDTYKVHELVTTLTGHVQNVVCLAWSPYISGYLISGSYDRTAQVWNVETQELIATYTGHSGPVLCCMWSPLNPDYIITGSADSTVRIWKIAYNLPQEKVYERLRNKTKKKQNKSNKVANTLIENNLTELTKATSECSLLDVCQINQKSKVVVTTEPKSKKSQRSYFSKSFKVTCERELLLDSLLNIIKSIKNENFNIEEVQEDTSYHMIPILFSAQENFVSCLTNEKCAHAEKNKYDVVTEMDVWCDNLNQNLEEAAKEKRLNDFLVSLSASLSMKMWKDMCELYAYQLVTEGNPYKAVSYLLCIHKTYKAIEVFQDANLYKEAYILARCKLESDDPVLTEILKHWEQYSVKLGNFEQAAYISAKLGEFSDTVKYLARRKDALTLVTAAKIALLCNDDILSKSVVEQALIAAFTNSDYGAARNIIATYSYLKYQEIHLLTFEELEKVIEKDVSFDMIQMWIDGKSNYGLLQTLETICGDCTCYYFDLCQNSFCNILDNERMLWLIVGHEVALAIASTEKEQKLKHIVTALHSITQFEILHQKELKNYILIEIIIKLDIKSVMDEMSIYTRTEHFISISLRAYLCYALLNWFIYNIDKEPVNNNVQIYVNLIEHLLQDALNKQVVRHWTVTNEINQLENQIASVKCKAQKESKTDQDVSSVMEELNVLKTQKKQILNELVHVPNPVMVYGKANELCSKLLDETIKDEFSKNISTTWLNAMS